MSTSPVPVCAALADETRWQILEFVGEQPLTASQLAQLLPVSRQAIAKHLGVLESVGLVSAVKQGREVRYEALGAPLTRLAHRLEVAAQAWDQRLARLRDIAEALERP